VRLYVKSTCRYLSLPLMFLILSSVAMDNDNGMKPQTSWFSSLSFHIPWPSRETLLSPKWLIVAGCSAIGLGSIGYFLWKRPIEQAVTPLIAKSTDIAIKKVFNPPMNLATYIKMRNSITKDVDRQILDLEFQQKIDANIPNNTDAWGKFMAVKKTLCEKQEQQAISNTVQESKSKNECVGQHIRIPQAPMNIGDESVKLVISACNGQITRLSKWSFQRLRGGETPFPSAHSSFDEKQLEWLNGTLQELNLHQQKLTQRKKE
jgi:hypothetical protein